MAFPTSPSNNDVHKEGNRAFVYDSTLGVWDQVREADRLSSESGGGILGTVAGATLGTGTTISSAATFPAGHVIQTVMYKGSGSQYSSTVSGDWVTVGGGTFKPSITITPGNKIAFFGSYMMAAWNGGVDVGANLRVMDTTNHANTLLNINGDSNYMYISVQSSAGNELDTAIPINTLYTPAAGAKITFDTQVRANWSGTLQFNIPMSSVVMMEIQA